MDKLTQKNLIAEMAEKNGYKLFLWQLLVPPLAAEYRRAHDELRKEGWIITVKQNYKERRNNLYTYLRPGSVLKPVKPLKEKPTNTTDDYEDIKRRYIASSTEGRIKMLRDAKAKTPQNHREFVEIGKQISILSKGSGT